MESTTTKEMDLDYVDGKSTNLIPTTELETAPPKRTRRLLAGEKLRSADKVERIPVKVIPTTEILRKPPWMRVRLSASPKVQEIKPVFPKRTLICLQNFLLTRNEESESLTMVMVTLDS